MYHTGYSMMANLMVTMLAVVRSHYLQLETGTHAPSDAASATPGGLLVVAELGSVVVGCRCTSWGALCAGGDGSDGVCLQIQREYIVIVKMAGALPAFI
jgi:hypothetical protein